MSHFMTRLALAAGVCCHLLSDDVPPTALRRDGDADVAREDASRFRAIFRCRRYFPGAAGRALCWGRPVRSAHSPFDDGGADDMMRAHSAFRI